MELSPTQDALITLRSIQDELETNRELLEPNNVISDYREKREQEVADLMAKLNIKPKNTDLIEWLLSGNGWKYLEREVQEMLPVKKVTLTDNDRSLVALMLELGATSEANPKAAELLMAGIGGGDYKNAFHRLKDGGYARSGTGRGSGWYLTKLGVHFARELKSQQNNTL